MAFNAVHKSMIFASFVLFWDVSFLNGNHHFLMTVQTDVFMMDWVQAKRVRARGLLEDCALIICHTRFVQLCMLFSQTQLILHHSSVLLCCFTSDCDVSVTHTHFIKGLVTMTAEEARTVFCLLKEGNMFSVADTCWNNMVASVCAAQSQRSLWSFHKQATCRIATNVMCEIGEDGICPPFEESQDFCPFTQCKEDAEQSGSLDCQRTHLAPPFQSLMPTFASFPVVDQCPNLAEKNAVCFFFYGGWQTKKMVHVIFLLQNEMSIFFWLTCPPCLCLDQRQGAGGTGPSNPPLNAQQPAQSGHHDIGRLPLGTQEGWSCP